MILIDRIYLYSLGTLLFNYLSPYIFLNALVYLEGLVLAVLSPGAGLYASGSSSDILVCFLNCASRRVFIALPSPLWYLAGCDPSRSLMSASLLDLVRFDLQGSVALTASRGRDELLGRWYGNCHLFDLLDRVQPLTHNLVFAQLDDNVVAAEVGDDADFVLTL